SVQAAGSTGDSASVTFKVVSAPSIALSLISGPVGTTVGVTGSGFAPSDSGGACTVSGAAIVGTPNSNPTCTITPAGTITATGGLFFTVASAPAAAYTVTVTGSSGDQAQAPFTVTTPAIAITLNPPLGQTGAVVAVSGSGFVSGDAGIGIPCLTGSVVTGAPQLCTFSATGIMSSSFTVADVPVGPYSVQAAGSTGDSASVTFKVVSAPSIALSLISGP